MRLCRVTGDVVSTVKNKHLEGQRILVVQPVDLDKATPLGTSFLALDLTHSCGVSDLVLTIKEGGGVRIAMDNKEIPLAAVIVAAVDELSLADEASLQGTSLVEHTLQGGEA